MCWEATHFVCFWNLSARLGSGGWLRCHHCRRLLRCAFCKQSAHPTLPALREADQDILRRHMAGEDAQADDKARNDTLEHSNPAILIRNAHNWGTDLSRLKSHFSNIYSSHESGSPRSHVLSIHVFLFLNSQERFFIVSWDNLSLRRSDELLQPLGGSEPRWMISSEPSLRNSITPLFSHVSCGHQRLQSV